MTTALVVWFVAAVIVSAALAAMAYVWSRPRPTTLSIVHLPDLLDDDPVTDPFDPAWTPPGGRWDAPTTFHDVAARHPCMIGDAA